MAFRPGSEQVDPRPLARFLPRLPGGVVSGWLKDNLPPGSWVIDPFGASPQLCVEAANAGYRVLVAANNPIGRFLIEMAAAPPDAEGMQAALAELGSARRGEERLDPHIRALYETQCDHCGETVSAQAFLWEAEADAPYARIYTCPHCQHSGEFPATEEDVQKAGRYVSNSLHRARALERIAPQGSPERAHAEEALGVYPTRAVYALFTLINKLGGLAVDKEQKRLLDALMITAFDQGNTLWSHPGGRERPKQLSASPKYRENNIWLALENGIAEWTEAVQRTALHNWPSHPPETGGISLFEGRLRDLAGSLAQVRIGAVVTALPRPNQAFWTLSALWSGWLWGAEALGPFVNVLRRRRYDWAWHTTALEAALRRLSGVLPAKTPFFGLVTEAEAGFDAAAIIAAGMAGFDLHGIAMRERSGQTQLAWQREAGKRKPGKKREIAAAAWEASQAILQARGEPMAYTQLQNAGLGALAESGLLSSLEKEPGEAYSQVRDEIEAAHAFRGGFVRFGGSESSLEVGRWWLAGEEGIEEALADRVEKALVSHLISQPPGDFAQVDAAICAAFPGLLTPGEELVRVTLDSYATQSEDGNWQLRAADAAKGRRADLEEMKQLLAKMGEGMGYKIDGGAPLAWASKRGKIIYRFHVIASAVLGNILFAPENRPEGGVIVLPGGRSNLVTYKLARDPRLKAAFESGWRFLKFRHVRRLAENPPLTPESFAEQFTLDPLTQDQAQMPLL
jgi:hypothetical protein